MSFATKEGGEARKAFACFGIEIHGIGLEELALRLNDARQKATWIVTTNSEILLEARRNPEYRDCLLSADIRMVDSFGLQIAGWVLGARPTRLPGVDCAEWLLAEADREHWKVALIGGEQDIGQRAVVEKQKKYPGIRFHYEHGGGIDVRGQGDEEIFAALERIREFSPEIVLVAFGHPKQEMWISKNLQLFPDLKLIMGVGGTFDYWAGTVIRAPRWLQRLGLEWLWRLFHEPKRWRRIANAVIVFPMTATLDRVRRVFVDKKP